MILKAKVLILLTEQMLKQIWIIYSDKETKLYTDKVGRIGRIGSNNIDMTDKVIIENIYNIFFLLKLRI